MFNKLFLIALFAATAAVAQDKQPAPSPTTSVFRVEYTVTYTNNDNKKSEAHSYTLLLADRQRGRMRVGSRVPYRSGDKLQYMDVGVNFDAQPFLTDSGSVRLDTTCELSGVIREAKDSDSGPVLQNTNVGVQAIVPLDKLVTLTTQEGPANNTTVQLQVIVKLFK